MSRIGILACSVALSGGIMTAHADFLVRDLGIPVRGVNWVQLIVGKDSSGRECLYAVMGQQADNLIVLQIDPLNGTFHQAVAPGSGSNYPTTAIWGKDDRLYIAAAWSAHLLCFDPKDRRIADLGPINPPDEFPCRIDNAPDGSLFIGTYGSASLTRYDPATRQFRRYGRCDEVEMYCYPLVAPDGIVAGQIGSATSHVVLVDPKTGEKKRVGPIVRAGEAGKSVSLQRGADGLLYIISTEGNFRIHGMELEKIGQPPAPEAPQTLADGSTFSFADAEQQEYRQLVIQKPSGEKRQFDLDYEASGSSIFLLHLGPDGKIYGSSVMPLHLFRYDPADGSLADLGRCSPAAGDAYSMGNLDGKLYIGSYPGAMLSVYDPSRAYQFGDTPSHNPRNLGRMDEVSYRPRAMLTGPLGRVWTGSIPVGGLWGGPLAWYDPATGEKKNHRQIIPDQSLTALAWLESLGLMAGGTSIGGGTGTQPKATEAVVFLWDPVKEQTVWSGVPRAGTQRIRVLLALPNGRLYGIAVGRDSGGEEFHEIFVFDPARREFVRSMPAPKGGVLDNSLQLGADGNIYGLSWSVLYRIDPKTDTLEELFHLRGEFQVVGPLVGKTLYFATNHRLRSLTMP
jgi:hypothetical protein